MSTSINTHDGVTVFLTSATEADVHADGAVVGIQAVDGDALRDRVVAFVQERAQRLGIPATAALIDDSSHWTLTVEPDGRVTEAPTGLVTESFEPRPAPTATPTPTPTATIPTIPAAPVAAPTAAAAPAATAAPKPHRPTVEDLLSSRPRQRPLKATMGWQGRVRRMSGGLISPKPSATEQTRHDQTNRVQKRLDGPRTIVVLNPKGGAHKTTSTLLLAATFGRLRGGSTLAWDNNETRGTLGWRAQHTPHHRTAVDLLGDLERFENPSVASLSQLDDYVRTQVDARFDVLASDEDAAATSTIDEAAFDRLHRTLSRYYRLLIIDTGNNMRASNWVAAVAAADQLVIVSTVREDTAASAAWLLDGLAEKGFGDKVDRAVTILTSPSEKPDRELEQRLADHFGALTAAVTTIPYDPALVDGGTIDFDSLSAETHDAWLNAAAVVADQL
ncbi:MinD/ParA family ATP-binding protein [Agromyces cerinus]|uniref:MinD-like ATPase involved in chromosome partitioning or flagellar assembly n=1 Tax=Agromyces cerinus subsp. cerinus TaxID=232089 RepID=A0A1N6EWK3_9MICO|nr:chromosome partitioning protein [Agromyces cerinus]SIN87472.1 MinD-like ATPase involved in chromosome partitioning or flagellar assembly [Agromyces cerinus subsp. cerinus]